MWCIELRTSVITGATYVASLYDSLDLISGFSWNFMATLFSLVMARQAGPSHHKKISIGFLFVRKNL